MAEFNKDVVSESNLNNPKYKFDCAMMMMRCLSDEDYDALRDDWCKAGGSKVIDWYEFVFNKVSVKYER